MFLEFELNERSLKIFDNKKIKYQLPYLWIRDNCSCDWCRVKETQEKRFMLHNVSKNLKPKEVYINNSNLNVCWPDNHKTIINFKDIEFLKNPRKPKKNSMD